MEHLVFAYGTLKSSKTRKALLNREVPAVKDILAGFVLDKIFLDGVKYPVAVRDPFNRNPIHGEVFKVNSAEMNIIDNYESDAYQRIKVRLVSGKLAWLYIRN